MISFALYLITDPSSTRLLEITEAALSAAPLGAIAVQARAKGASARELAELSSALLPICHARAAKLLVNDRADVAKAVGADGVHLPERGLTVAQARRVLGPSALIGRSCHDRAGLERAQQDGADLATLGPIVGAQRSDGRPTPAPFAGVGMPSRSGATHVIDEVPEKGAPLGVDGFAAIVNGLAIPTYALGGVDEDHAPALREAGAAGVAVIRAVYGASDAARAVRGLIGSRS